MAVLSRAVLRCDIRPPFWANIKIRDYRRRKVPRHGGQA